MKPSKIEQKKTADLNILIIEKAIYVLLLHFSPVLTWWGECLGSPSCMFFITTIKQLPTI